MIDTLKTAHQLEASGIPQPQAEAIANAIQDIRTTGLATKEDIALVRGEITALRGELTVLRGELTNQRWMMGVLFAMQIAIFVKLFFR